MTDDGGASITARGVCRNTTGNPDMDDTCTSDGTGTGAFVSSLTGLTPVTTHYVRAYAQNSVCTAYGDEVSFATCATTPTVTTATAFSIEGDFASCGGDVSSNGGAEVDARGLCWNTSGSPDTNDTCTSDGAGMGAFTRTLTGLCFGTTHYVRAYACNCEGTRYGEEIFFTTEFDNDGVDFVIEDGCSHSPER